MTLKNGRLGVEGVRHLLTRHQMLKDDRTNWEPAWQEMADYYVPNKAPIVTLRQAGTKRTEKLFDSTALDCVARLTAAMQGNITPKQSKWFYLKMRNEDLNKNNDTAKWLEDVANRIRTALNQSNMHSQTNELYIDIISFCTAAMIEEEKPSVAGKFGGLVFKSLGCGTYWIEEDGDEIVDTIFHEFKMSARAAVKKWPDAQEKSEKIKQAMLPGGKPDARFTFLHAIFPREGNDLSADPGTPVFRLPYASAYICLEDKKLIYEGGYHEFPGMVPRWSKTSDEVYGRGPGYIALPDVKTLNRVRELGLKQWAKEIDPPMKVMDQGVIGSVRTTPGGQTIVSDMNGIDRLLPAAGNVNVNKFNIEMLVQSIRAMFFADQLQLRESSRMTAEEVRARLDLMQRVLGPTFGRLETELLSRMIERTFKIMVRAGALPLPPQAVIDAFRSNEAEIDVEYEGPLARAQRNIEAEAIDALYAGMLPIANIKPEVMDVINDERAQRYKGKILGVPESVMSTDDELKKLRADRAQQQKEMMDKAKAESSAQTAKTTAEAAGKMADLPPDQNGMESQGMPPQ